MYLSSKAVPEERVDLVDADVIADLNGHWPFEDNSVGVIRSFDVFEHLSSIMHTMSELYRVLAPGGMAYIQVPSTDGRGAFQDPTHVSFWNNNSFFYWTQAQFQHYIPNLKEPIRFQSIKCYTTPKDADGVCWARALLMKLGNDRVPGIVSI
jgi:SAM-dependent methyltransferase